MIDRTTAACIAPPTAFPTNPPLTAACLVTVDYTNHPTIAPSAATVQSPVQYLYKTGLVPMLGGGALLPTYGAKAAIMTSGVSMQMRVSDRFALQPGLNLISTWGEDSNETQWVAGLGLVFGQSR